jgi:integrase
MRGAAGDLAQAERNGCLERRKFVDVRKQKWWAANLRTDDTRKRLRFHDLRGTGLTWMAIRGDDPLKIQQRAGHRTFEMTHKYIRTLRRGIDRGVPPAIVAPGAGLESEFGWLRRAPPTAA